MVPQYGQEENVDKIWEKAIIVEGSDPNEWRLGFDFAAIRRSQLNVQDRPGGWQIHHRTQHEARGANRSDTLFPISIKFNSTIPADIQFPDPRRGGANPRSLAWFQSLPRFQRFDIAKWESFWAAKKVRLYGGDFEVIE